jgi:hypothetical protein
MSGSEFIDKLPSNDRFGYFQSLPLAPLMSAVKHRQLIDFLQTELAIPAESIAMAVRQTTEVPGMLPIVLWKYGLVTIYQLEQIFDWLENRPSTSML